MMQDKSDTIPKRPCICPSTYTTYTWSLRYCVTLVLHHSRRCSCSQNCFQLERLKQPYRGKWALAWYSCSAHKAGYADKDGVCHDHPAHHLNCLACATWQSRQVITHLNELSSAVSTCKTLLLCVSHIYGLCVCTCRMWKSLRPEQLSSGS